MANWPIGFLAVHVLATSAQLGESHQATSLAPISWDRDAKRHLRKRRRRGSPKSALILRILSSFLPMCHGQNIKKKVLVIHKQKNVNQSMCFDWCVFPNIDFGKSPSHFFPNMFFPNIDFQSLVFGFDGHGNPNHIPRAPCSFAASPRSTPWSLPRWWYANPRRGWGAVTGCWMGMGYFWRATPQKIEI